MKYLDNKKSFVNENESKKEVLSIALPKGSLQESTVKLFQRAGYCITGLDRSYSPKIDDDSLKIRFVRAQEIARYVEEGVFDVGLTGLDWIRETKSDVVEVNDLCYSKTGIGKIKIVLAVSKDSDIVCVNDLEGKKIATEVVNITKDYLCKKNVNAKVEFSWGATEVKVPEIVDAVVELTETGRSLEANNLRVIDVLLESTTKFIANKNAWSKSEKRRKIENLSLLLEGTILAQQKVGLKMNAPRESLRDILSLLPSMRAPTISKLDTSGWFSLEVVVTDKHVREFIPELKRYGACDIIEYQLNKVIS